MRRTKKVSDSTVTMVQQVLPNDTNPLGNLLGGTLMHWMDICAGLAAARHANEAVVTAAVDHIDFKHPVHMGEMVTLTAKLTKVGRTSMNISMEAVAENLKTGNTIIANRADFVFVAMDSEYQPTEVPLLEAEE